MDIGNIHLKCEDIEKRMMSNYCYLNNLITSNIRTELPSTDLVYFEIPLDSVDVCSHTQDYFCSFQRCFNSFTSVDDEHQINWSHSSAVSRDCNAEFTEEILSRGDTEDNFLYKLNTGIGEKDVTDLHEEDEFKGVYCVFIDSLIRKA